ncbi:DEAD/DEAH box helicase [uncultured Hydrogenophaga sp.]|uniref:DEAD/DEAH box helicase n=1 Tax=uncultured Hydrogenophaga sp. TaxID=199683 RepID=UPI00265EF532|nr:DEAD/DEAH box helicase [uncultured Hydrogenophaga sp.]
MSDSFEERGDAAPDTLNTIVEAAVEAVDTPVADAGPVDASAFAALGLAPELVAAVADLGYTQPTAVQARVMPKALLAEGETRHADLMVSSQTGSGKTAAFLLPVLHTLLQQRAEATARERAERERLAAEALARGETPPKAPKRKDPTNPRHFKAATPGALVLCPTRELAQQVAHDAIDLVRHCRGLRVANVVGGMPYQLQIAKLQNADLVVATPGRLLDLQRSQQLKLDEVQFLVVDEADRMLDLGFADDLAEVNLLTAQRRQTMMFSATFAPRIQQLAMRVMHDNGSQVQKIQIDSPQEQHANIKQVLFWADTADHKRKMLDHWLRDTTINQAIVFASTQIECDGLANDLQQAGFSAVALHGALSQGIRNRRLMALRSGQVQILVATDVAARGIDVPTITHVFNFGLPMKAEDYTHRIGRTGRAGRDGLAVTFAEQRDRRRIADIEAYTRQRFTAEVIPGLEPRMRAPQPEFGRGRPGGDRFGGRNDRGGDRRSGPPSRGPRFENRDSAPRFDPRGDSRGEFRAGPRSDFRGDAPVVDRSRPDGRFDPRFEGREAPAFEGRGAPRGDFRDQRPAPRSFDDRGPARAGKPAGFSAGRSDKGGFADRNDRGGFADRGGERNYADRSGFNDRGSRPAPRRAPR